MAKSIRRHLTTGMLGMALALAMAASLACAGEATPTPVRPAPTATPVPTAAPQPTLAPVPTPIPTTVPLITKKPQYGGILRQAHRLGADTFDPHYNTSSYNYIEMYAFYESLVQSDPKGNFVPSLATNWEVAEDGKNIIFHLQRGVKFHDGTDFNAQAVKFNYDRILNPDNLSPQRSLLGELERVEVLDEYTARFRLTRPFRPLLGVLIDRPGWIASPASIQKLGKDFGSRPVSTGPFKWVEWIPGKHVVYTRNDNYWDKGKPYLDGIRFLDVADVTIQVAMLRTDEIDITDREIRAADLPVIERNPNLKVSRLQSGRMFGLVFDLARPPFDKLALRQAVGYAMDRPRAINVIVSGAGAPAYNLRGSGWDYNPGLKFLEYDPQKAKQKLAEAGYPSGVTLPFASMSSQDELFMSETYQAILQEVGIRLDIKLFSPADYFDTVTGKGGLHNVGFARTSWSPRADPHLQMAMAFRSTGQQAKNSHLNNPEIDRLIDEAATIYDLEKVKKMYDQINTLVGLNAHQIPVYHPYQFVAMNKRVQNYEWVPDAQLRLRFLWLEK